MKTYLIRSIQRTRVAEQLNKKMVQAFDGLSWLLITLYELLGSFQQASFSF